MGQKEERWDDDLQRWWYPIADYAVYDRRGIIIGVKEDAPEEIKQMWKKLQEQKEYGRRTGQKID